jgi:hypothetical protein
MIYNFQVQTNLKSIKVHFKVTQKLITNYNFNQNMFQLVHKMMQKTESLFEPV